MKDVSRDGQIKFRTAGKVAFVMEPKDSDDILRDTTGTRLVSALGTQPDPPCVNRGDGLPCEFYRRCASERMACKAFYAYTREPLDKRNYSQWLLMKRHPNPKWYKKIYVNTKVEIAGELQAEKLRERRQWINFLLTLPPL